MRESEQTPSTPNGHPAPKHTPHKQTDSYQAKRLQHLGYKIAMALDEDLIKAKTPDARREVAIAYRSAVQAWDVCANRARIAKGKPLPGSLRPEQTKVKKSHQKSGAHWSESPTLGTSPESDKPPA